MSRKMVNTGRPQYFDCRSSCWGSIFDKGLLVDAARAQITLQDQSMTFQLHSF